MSLRSLAGKLRGLLPGRAAASRAAVSDLEKLSSKPLATKGSEDGYETIMKRMQAETVRSREQFVRNRGKHIVIRVGTVASSLGFVWLATSSVAVALADADF
ncbi:hypothetical protein EJB05_14681 [Eragrostis curvula]|uniref:Uncharacterized protein n=1 Tax=Eragrostis curvula TaxID=38414 RepID=A0A5J9VXM2_9POAL|nr:hypothetical protein EJB05_14681 [Eragrostis curvula]